MIPLVNNKEYGKPSVFTPANLLREARRQKGIAPGSVPEVCVLDPDGDLWRALKHEGAPPNPFWACYHTELIDCALPGGTVGVLGCAVGSSFAVLVAEELFASGCRLLISVTSAGQIVSDGTAPPYFVLIDRALRDEGTSVHYVPPSQYIAIGDETLCLVQQALSSLPGIHTGGTWTTDAPFRETEEAIAFARAEGLRVVEMEAAALYALAQAKGYPVVCFAHVTNQMAVAGDDFEKGEADGNVAFRQLITTVAQAWRASR